MNDLLYLPYTATWKPKSNASRGGSTASGREDSTLRTEKDVSLFFDPKTPAGAERYGVIGLNRPYLVMGQADDLEPMMRGDLILWGDKVLEVAQDPMIFRPGDGYDHGELIAFDQQYGRMIL